MTMAAPNRLKWHIHKYSRLVKNLDCQEGNHLMTETNVRLSSAQEKWDNFSSVNCNIELIINLETFYLAVVQDHLILESIFLMSEKECLHVLAKGDSSLMSLKKTDFIRKFRVQFKESLGRSGVEQCEDCVRVLSNYINTKTIKESSGVVTVETGPKKKLSGTASLSDMSQFLTEPSNYAINRTYNVNPGDPEQMKEIVMLCLVDADFPSFVGDVETCLQNLAGPVNSTS